MSQTENLREMATTPSKMIRLAVPSRGQCVYVACPNFVGKCEKTFCPFPPKNEAVCRKWVMSSGNPDLIELWSKAPRPSLLRDFLVCEDHFDPKQVVLLNGKLLPRSETVVPRPYNPAECIKRLYQENRNLKRTLAEKSRQIEELKIKSHDLELELSAADEYIETYSPLTSPPDRHIIYQFPFQRVLEYIVDKFEGITLHQFELIKCR